LKCGYQNADDVESQNLDMNTAEFIAIKFSLHVLVLLVTV